MSISSIDASRNDIHEKYTIGNTWVEIFVTRFLVICKGFFTVFAYILGIKSPGDDFDRNQHQSECYGGHIDVFNSINR